MEAGLIADVRRVRLARLRWDDELGSAAIGKRDRHDRGAHSAIGGDDGVSVCAGNTILLLELLRRHRVRGPFARNERRRATEHQCHTETSHAGVVHEVPSRPRYIATTVPKRRAGAIESQETRSEEHTSELQSLAYLVCRLVLEKKK